MEATDIMSKIAAAEKWLELLLQKEPPIPGLDVAKAGLVAARRKVADVQGKLNALGAVRQDLARRLPKDGNEPPLGSGDAFLAWLTGAQDARAALEDANRWDMLWQKRLADAQRELEHAKREFDACFERASGQDMRNLEGQLYIAEGAPTVGKQEVEHLKALLAERRRRWHERYEQALAELDKEDAEAL